MMQQWQQLALKFNELTLRERRLIIGTIAILLLVCFYLPLEVSYQQYQKQLHSIERTQQQIQLSKQVIDEFKQRLTLDPNEDYRQQLTQLQANLSEVEDQFAIHNFVPASYMPLLLSEVLAKAKGIKLISFDSIRPEPLVHVSDNKENMNLYSHGVKLTLEGDYFSILRFIDQVESMQNKLYWKSMNYQVKRYPKANVELEFYTLSMNEDFISVAN